jgi:hypothetical protein
MEPHESSVGGEPAAVEGGFQSESASRLKEHRLCGTIAYEGASFGYRRVFEQPDNSEEGISPGVRMEAWHGQPIRTVGFGRPRRP